MSKNKAKVQDVVLGHGEECDGIEEYDNALPSWWLGLFYVTVIFGVCYAVYYHFIGHISQKGIYDAEIVAAEVRWPKPALAAVDLSPAAVAEGEAFFQTTCVACHGKDLAGGIGPSLIDDTWIHGGSPEEILKTITEGVGTKGMPAWGPVLGGQKVAAAAAFIYTRANAAKAGP